MFDPELFRVGDRVEVTGFVYSTGVAVIASPIFQADVEDVDPFGLNLLLNEPLSGSTSKLCWIGKSSVATVRLLSLKKPYLCHVCRRDADPGKPCWWCGTPL